MINVLGNKHCVDLVLLTDKYGMGLKWICRKLAASEHTEDNLADDFECYFECEIWIWQNGTE